MFDKKTWKTFHVTTFYLDDYTSVLQRIPVYVSHQANEPLTEKMECGCVMEQWYSTMFMIYQPQCRVCHITKLMYRWSFERIRVLDESNGRMNHTKIRDCLGHSATTMKQWIITETNLQQNNIIFFKILPSRQRTIHLWCIYFIFHSSPVRSAVRWVVVVVSLTLLREWRPDVLVRTSAGRWWSFLRFTRRLGSWYSEWDLIFHPGRLRGNGWEMGSRPRLLPPWYRSPLDSSRRPPHTRATLIHFVVVDDVNHPDDHRVRSGTIGEHWMWQRMVRGERWMLQTEGKKRPVNTYSCKLSNSSTTSWCSFSGLFMVLNRFTYCWVFRYISFNPSSLFVAASALTCNITATCEFDNTTRRRHYQHRHHQVLSRQSGGACRLRAITNDTNTHTYIHTPTHNPSV